MKHLLYLLLWEIEPDNRCYNCYVEIKEIRQIFVAQGENLPIISKFDITPTNINSEAFS